MARLAYYSLQVLADPTEVNLGSGFKQEVTKREIR
jgi:hypothetical protein